MTMYGSLYREKLTTPEKAVATVKEGSLLIYGVALAEPPAILEAFAERLRADDLKRLRILSSLPLAHAQNTVLATDLVDRVERCAQTVAAHRDGDIRRYSLKLKGKLGNFHIDAKRFEALLENPIFSKYSDFKEILDYFASENCRGCRNEQCKLFKECGVRACHQEMQIDYCHQCELFPCDRTGSDEGLYKGWIMINEKIREMGLEKFHEKARTRPRYP